VAVVAVHPITVAQLAQAVQAVAAQEQREQHNLLFQEQLTQAVVVVECATSPTLAVTCQVQVVQVLLF
jgi:hypothetical protein